jgi:hypothetical protein
MSPGRGRKSRFIKKETQALFLGCTYEGREVVKKREEKLTT